VFIVDRPGRGQSTTKLRSPSHRDHPPTGAWKGDDGFDLLSVTLSIPETGAGQQGALHQQEDDDEDDGGKRNEEQKKRAGSASRTILDVIVVSVAERAASIGQAASDWPNSFRNAIPNRIRRVRNRKAEMSRFIIRIKGLSFGGGFVFRGLSRHHFVVSVLSRARFNLMIPCCLLRGNLISLAPPGEPTVGAFRRGTG
jgi:hypothetical protein